MATKDQGLNRQVVVNVKYKATRAGTRAFIYIMSSKLKASELYIIAAAKAESQYIQVEKDVLAYLMVMKNFQDVFVGGLY